MWKFVRVVPILAMLFGCATTGNRTGVTGQQSPGSAGQHTAMKRAIGQCTMIVGLGAIGGALISGNAKKGALIGAGLGAGACAVLLSLAAEEDQQRVRELERQAIVANAERSTSFQTKSGANAQVSTVVRAADPGERQVALGFTACRYSETTATVDGQSAPAGRQLWCRTDVGDWQPVAG